MVISIGKRNQAVLGMGLMEGRSGCHFRSNSQRRAFWEGQHLSEVINEVREWSKPIPEGQISRQRKQLCKGPKVGVCLWVLSRSRKPALVEGVREEECKG